MATPPAVPSRPPASVHTKIIALALVPSMAFSAGCLGIGWYLSDGAVGRAAQAELVVRKVTVAQQLWSAVVDEQRAAALGPGEGLASARTRVDAASAAVVALAQDPAAGAAVGLRQSFVQLREAVDAVPAARQQVRPGQPGIDAYVAYDVVVDPATAALAGNAVDGADADVATAFSGTDAALRVAESVLATTTIAATAGGRAMDGDVYQAFVAEAGGLPSALGPVAAALGGPSRDATVALAATPEWKRTGTDIAQIIRAGPVDPRPLDRVSVSGATAAAADIVPAGTAVAKTLTGIAFDGARTAATLQADRARAALNTLVAVVLGAVGIAVLIMIIGFRMGARLVRRLTALREDTLETASRLPLVLERLRLGEDVELAPAIAGRDHGSDEIGQIAAAVDVAQRAAIDAAAEEARTLAGANAVFLTIAHRSQAIVHRQLQVLDEAERAEHNSDQLARLFQLDHLTTRERRNAENLIIMGGQQPQRRWRKPVALIELLRSAISESEQYTRITLGDVPDTYVEGAAVGDLIHLVAELVDNATSFSPPQCEIDVRATAVGRGVVVEVQDRGLGIDPEPRARLNTMLADPPDFGLMTLSEDSRLGMFVVARLAHQHGVRVTLMESPYGGVQCIVLVPTALVVEPEESVQPDDAAEPEKPAQPPTAEVPEVDIDAGPPPLPERQPQEHLASKLKDNSPTVVPTLDAPQLPQRSSAAMSALQQGSRNGRSSPRPDGGHA